MINLNTLKAVKRRVEKLTYQDFDLETEEFFDKEANLPVWITDDKELIVSAESENSQLFVDYYGEFRGGYPFIHEKLEEIAEEFDGYWEWKNPGSISFAQ